MKVDRSVSTVEELMLAYAAGSTSSGLSLLCASQLTISPRHRALVDEFEAIGGALLAQEPERNGLDASFDDLMARIDASGPISAPARSGDPARDRSCAVPSPVLEAAGMPLDDIPWRTRLRGIQDHILWDDEGERVSLVKARPGAKVPGHTHRGLEATLVMSGAMRDGDAVLTAGDIALCGPEHDHHPEILGDEICYCLTVVDGGLRFTGAFGRALNWFAD